MRVILHIGQSKTGTSAIQAFLMLNRRVLEKNGVLYPVARVKGMPINLGAHNMVADFLLGHIRFPHRSADEYFEQFFSDAAVINADMLILSAEHFFGGEPRIWDVQDERDYFERYRKKIDRLAGYLSGQDVKILVYLRPQIDWMASAVSQTVRIERLMSDRRIYQDDRQFFRLMQPLLRYADLLDAWEAGVKPTALTVIPYERRILHKQSSISDFLLRTGLDKLDFEYASTDIRVNESLTNEFTEVKKILNQNLRSKTDERAIIRCLENLSRRHPGTTNYALDPTVQRDIEELVHGQNERVNSLYISNGMRLQASGSAETKAAPPSSDDIRRAAAIFEAEYARPKYWVLRRRFSILAFLRSRAKPVHAALHQFKVAYWKLKYRS